MRGSRILLEGVQVKSEAKVRRLCSALDAIEKECGIRSVVIEFDGVFFCPDINWKRVGRTPMQRLVRDIVLKQEKKTKTKGKVRHRRQPRNNGG